MGKNELFKFRLEVRRLNVKIPASGRKYAELGPGRRFQFC